MSLTPVANEKNRFNFLGYDFFLRKRGICSLTDPVICLIVDTKSGSWRLQLNTEYKDENETLKKNTRDGILIRDTEHQEKA